MRSASLPLVVLALVSCERRPSPAPRPAPAPRATGDVPVVHADAGAGDDTPLVPPLESRPTADLNPTSPVFILTGGVERARRGARFPLRVFLREADGGRDVDVTDRARLRVEPRSVGVIADGNYFEARALGRAHLVAQLGSQQARTIIEVSEDMPPDASVLPNVDGDAGTALRYFHFFPRPDGIFLFQVGFLDRSIDVQGPRRGSTFPMTVPVRSVPSDGGVSPPPTTGRVVFERWAAGELSGVLDVRTPQGPVRLRFSVHQLDPGEVTGLWDGGAR